MKKLLAVLLALCLGCVLLPAMAEEDITGTWYVTSLYMGENEVDPTMVGISIVFELNADGTGVATTNQQGEESTAEVSWSLADGKVTMTVDGEAANGELKDGKMTITTPGGDMVLSREASAFTVPQPVAAESEEAFLGTWNAVRAVVGDDGSTIIPLDMFASTLGMDLAASLNIEAGKASLSIRFLSEELPVAEGTTAFADGVLTITIEGLDPITVQLTDSGELFATIQVSQIATTLPLYFAPAEAEAAE